MCFLVIVRAKRLDSFLLLREQLTHFHQQSSTFNFSPKYQSNGLDADAGFNASAESAVIHEATHTLSMNDHKSVRYVWRHSESTKGGRFSSRSSGARMRAHSTQGLRQRPTTLLFASMDQQRSSVPPPSKRRRARAISRMQGLR